MKKITSLLLALICCFSLCATAAASAPDDLAEVELILPEGELQYCEIPECDEMVLEEDPFAADTYAYPPGAVSASTANIFEIEEFGVHPVIRRNGTNQYIENFQFTANIDPYAPATVRCYLTPEQQQYASDYVAQQGEELIGWYLTGTIHMECYLPHWVEYKTYDHVNHGEKTQSKMIYKSTYRGKISTYGLFPADMTQEYTYGFEGKGYMTVYYRESNSTKSLYPPFVMKVTFRNS